MRIFCCGPGPGHRIVFTGLVQGTGAVAGVLRQGEDCRLRIRPDYVLADLRDGESIAVNGACLSVEEHGGATFTAYASEETLARTNLGGLRQGERVNLERAIEAGQRLGGHLVTGHIDCLAVLQKKERAGQSLRLRLSFPSDFAAEVVAKGSVALDGISLTVNACGCDFLEVNIIPDSQKRTNLGGWQPGRRVNMETDIIGKYVIAAVRGRSCAPAAGISGDFLARHGFV